jgi:hypothetical protein
VRWRSRRTVPRKNIGSADNYPAKYNVFLAFVEAVFNDCCCFARILVSKNVNTTACNVNVSIFHRLIFMLFCVAG